MMGLSLCVPLLLSLAFGEDGKVMRAFLLPALLAVGLGLLSKRLRPERERALSLYDAFASVSLGWLGIVLVGALPYLLSGALPHPADAWFESMSGFTTTGATIIPLAELEGLPRSILFWRNLSQWLGGMGIIVLFVALLPSLGAGGSFLVQVEAPGPPARRMRPRIAESARILWKLYLGLTLFLAVLLFASGLSWFDALTHAFSTLSTGGFSPHADSVAAFSPLVQWEITFFMLVGGINFSLLFLLLQRRVHEALRDPELRTYLCVLAVAVVSLAVMLRSDALAGGESAPSGLHDQVRGAAFTVISLTTSTGFATEDFDLWPIPAHFVLVLLTITGGCAGSTAGGMKLIRAILVFKSVRRELFRMQLPSGVQHVKLQGRAVPEPLIAATMVFVALYAITWLLSILVLALLGTDVTTALSGSLACLSNIGPGLGPIGPSQDYTVVGVGGRLWMSFLMLLGRLEFYAVLMLFVPAMWRRPRHRKPG